MKYNGTGMRFEVIGITGLPIIKEKDCLAELFLNACREQGTPIIDGDIIVASHVIVSRAEGNIIDLNNVKPSKIAKNLAEYTQKDPRMVEVVMQNSRAIRRMAPGVLITETKQGFVCANAGVDKSNVPGELIVAPLPEDGDASAKRIRNNIKNVLYSSRMGKNGPSTGGAICRRKRTGIFYYSPFYLFCSRYCRHPNRNTPGRGHSYTYQR